MKTKMKAKMKAKKAICACIVAFIGISGAVLTTAHFPAFSVTASGEEGEPCADEGISAEEALEKLKAANEEYMESRTNPGDISPERRKYTSENGQKPYAIVLACSDSREIPEAIFCAGIGELFVIRVAGNVVDEQQLGSVEYAAEHLGCRLAVVLGHTQCGAVKAAMEHEADGYIKSITDEISLAIGDEKDEYEACCLNVKRSVEQIDSSINAGHTEEEGLQVVGAVYHLEDGHVEFL